MMLTSQATCESADRLVEKTDDTSGNMEDIGGEACTWGGVTLTDSVDVCAMAGETNLKATRITVTATSGWKERYHMTIQLPLILSNIITFHVSHNRTVEYNCPGLGYTQMGHRYNE